MPLTRQTFEMYYRWDKSTVSKTIIIPSGEHTDAQKDLIARTIVINELRHDLISLKEDLDDWQRAASSNEAKAIKKSIKKLTRLRNQIGMTTENNDYTLEDLYYALRLLSHNACDIITMKIVMKTGRFPASPDAIPAPVVTPAPEDDESWQEVYNSTDGHCGAPREYSGQPGTFYQTYGNGGGKNGSGGYWVRDDGNALWEVAGEVFKYLDGFSLETRAQDSMNGIASACKLVPRTFPAAAPLE